jgi:hypothetical protein
MKMPIIRLPGIGITGISGWSYFPKINLMRVAPILRSIPCLVVGIPVCGLLPCPPTPKFEWGRMLESPPETLIAYSLYWYFVVFSLAIFFVVIRIIYALHKHFAVVYLVG